MSKKGKERQLLNPKPSSSLIVPLVISPQLSNPEFESRGPQNIVPVSGVT